MAANAFYAGMLSLSNGGTAFASDDCYAVLLDSNYTFDPTDDTYSDISGDEIEDADYDPVALSGKSVSIVSTDTIRYGCSNISFGSEVTINAAGGSIVIVKGTAASPQAGDLLLFHWDLPAPGASSGAPFAVNTPNGLYDHKMNVPQD